MQQADKKPKTEEKEIGNNRFTQAMGEAGNIGIAATVVSTIVIAALLYFGKERVSWIGTTIQKIEGGFDWIKKKMGNGQGNGSRKMSEIMAAFAAASGAGYFIGHLAMIPAYREGWRKADAEKKLLKERGDMVKLMKEQIEEKDQEIGRLHMKLKNSDVDVDLPSETGEKKWATPDMKKNTDIKPRGHNHTHAIALEEPSEITR